MLNCCIRHKVSRVKNTAPVSQSTSSLTTAGLSEPEFYSPTSSLSYSQRVQEQQTTSEKTLHEESGREIFSTGSSDDEFFEANESFEKMTQISETTSKNSSLKTKRESLVFDDFNFDAAGQQPKALDMKPVDTDPLSLLANEENDMRPLLDTPEHRETAEMANKRLGTIEPCKDLVLIVTGEPLYVPETQVLNLVYTIGMCLSIATYSPDRRHAVGTTRCSL